MFIYCPLILFQPRGDLVFQLAALAAVLLLLFGLRGCFCGLLPDQMRAGGQGPDVRRSACCSSSSSAVNTTCFWPAAWPLSSWPPSCRSASRPEENGGFEKHSPHRHPKQRGLSGDPGSPQKTSARRGEISRIAARFTSISPRRPKSFGESGGDTFWSKMGYPYPSGQHPRKSWLLTLKIY